jgi:hypothetical protein
MKKIILIPILVMAALLAAAENPHMKSLSGGKIKQSILFDGKMFVLKFIDQTQVVDLNEYYLENETPENWTQMLSVSVYKTTGTPGAMARNMEQSLLKAHPDAPHELMATPDDKQALFMCVNWEGNRQTGSEFDVFRFQQTRGGVLGYQASLRPYQAKITTADYKALKDRWAQKIQSDKFPAVTLQMP